MASKKHSEMARSDEKQRAREIDLALIASGQKSAAQVNLENALGARVHYRPTFKFGVPSKPRVR